MEPEIVTQQITMKLCGCVQRKLGHKASKVIELELHTDVGGENEEWFKFPNILVWEGYCEEDVVCESGRKE